MAAIEERESELASLRQRAASFPVELDKAVDRARQAAAEELAREHAMQLTLSTKEREWETRMLTQQIEHLQATQR